MITLTIRTDNPQAEIGIYDDGQQLAYYTWQAHRQLAETIHLEMKAQLSTHQIELSDLQGIVAYKGPGSFTGLRIGLTVANTLANGLKIPIVSATGSAWQQDGIKRLQGGENEEQALPEYGALPHITTPRK